MVDRVPASPEDRILRACPPDCVPKSWKICCLTCQLWQGYVQQTRGSNYLGISRGLHRQQPRKHVPVFVHLLDTACIAQSLSRLGVSCVNLLERFARKLKLRKHSFRLFRWKPTRPRGRHKVMNGSFSRHASRFVPNATASL